MHGSTNEYEQERRTKVQRMRDLGVEPYGQRADGIDSLAHVKTLYTPEMGHDAGPVVKVAGRIILKRDFGKKLSFLTLRDESGDLQVALDAKRLSESAWHVRDLLDLGDQIVVEGNLGTTKTGEVTVWTTAISMASKALLPPPAKHEGLADVELRYRQRYVDLWANPDVMRVMQARIRIVEEIRNYMRSREFVEVETPMLQVLHGGAAARPFVTQSNALDIPLYLRIAPELYLKRLLVGGFRKVFELNRNFRNEGISPRHNPEFTMLETYEAFGNYETMMELIEGLICQCAENVIGSLRIEHKDAEGNVAKTINLQSPWRRVRMVDLVRQETEWEFDKRSIASQPKALWIAAAKYVARFDETSREKIARLIAEVKGWSLSVAEEDLKIHFSWQPGALERVAEDFMGHLRRLDPAEQLTEVFEKLIEPTLIDPVFVTHVPSVIIPLARENTEDPYFADVFELIINGVEIGPGYTELNDPDVQAKHFAHQVGDREEQQKFDEDFIKALKYGMPPAGGLGMGVDRLVSLLTGAESLRDVILFPLLKPL